MTRQATRRIEFTVPEELGQRYDEARGLVPMATWIKANLDTNDALDAAHEVVLDALAWLDPEAGKRLMASPSYRRFKAALKSQSSADAKAKT